MNDSKIRKMTIIAMLSAIAYILMFYIRIPISFPMVDFLKYEPKDVIIVISGFLMGPMSAFVISLLVSLIEMFTISTTGPIGFVMNVISTCSFACTAAFVYKKKRSITGAVFGLICGTIAMVILMLAWNYFILPLYMPYVSREAVKPLLVSVFLPFNILKGGLNSAIAFLLYKPVVRTLRKTKLIPKSQNSGKKFSPFTVIALVVLITCVLAVLAFNNII